MAGIETISGNNIVRSGIILDDMTLIVRSGAMTSSVIVNSKSFLTLVSGGRAADVIVSPGGELVIGRDCTATRIKEQGGSVDVQDGGTATFVPSVLSGFINYAPTVHSGTTAVSTVVEKGGIHVFSGGIASDTTVKCSGGLYVAPKGTATKTNVFWSGYFSVESGANVTDATINHGGRMMVQSGVTATGIKENGGFKSRTEQALRLFPISSAERSTPLPRFIHPAGSIPRCLRRIRIEECFCVRLAQSRVRSGVIPRCLQRG